LGERRGKRKSDTTRYPGVTPGTQRGSLPLTLSERDSLWRRYVRSACRGVSSRVTVQKSSSVDRQWEFSMRGRPAVGVLLSEKAVSGELTSADGEDVFGRADDLGHGRWLRGSSRGRWSRRSRPGGCPNTIAVSRSATSRVSRTCVAISVTEAPSSRAPRAAATRSAAVH
jgi:hypothetical protein